MTEGARESRPPDVVMRVVNPLMLRLLRSPVGRALPALAVLQFTGRKSGRSYRVVTGWYDVNGREFAVTPAAWKQNFAPPAALTVTNRGATRSGLGRLESDPAVVAPVVQQLLDQGTPARSLAMVLPNRGVVTVEDIIATRKALIRFMPSRAAEPPYR